jgi:hypothetical protein
MSAFVVVVSAMLLFLASGANASPSAPAGSTTSSPATTGNESSQLAVLLNRVAVLENLTDSCSYQIAAFQATLKTILDKINCEFTFTPCI